MSLPDGKRYPEVDAYSAQAVPVQATAVPAQQAYAQPAYAQPAQPPVAQVYIAQPVTHQQQQPNVVYVQQQQPPVRAGQSPYAGCRFCGGPVIVQSQISGQQICWFIVLLLFFWPLCWLPFVMPECADKTARCARCGRF
jgi:hypothetical protein